MSSVILVHPGTVDVGDSFFSLHWPEAAAVADPAARLFDAFGLERGSVGQLLGPGALASAVMSAWQGDTLGRPAGDVRRMPGMALVRDACVVRRYRYRHAGDHARFAAPAGELTAFSSSPAAP